MVPTGKLNFEVSSIGNNFGHETVSSECLGSGLSFDFTGQLKFGFDRALKLISRMKTYLVFFRLNFRVSNHAAKSGNLSLWVSSVKAFSNNEIHKTSTKFVKSIDKKTVYSQGNSGRVTRLYNSLGRVQSEFTPITI